MRKNYSILKTIFTLLFLTITLTGNLWAQDNQQAPPDEKQKLGAWWLKSSLLPEPMPEKYLFHTELEYSYIAHSGNLEGSEQEGKLLFATRKNRFTNYILTDVSKTKLDIYPSGQKVDIYSYYVENIFRFDLTKIFYTDLGFIWERDNNKLLDRSNTYYLGLGYFYSIPHRIDASLFLGGGSQNNDYSLPVIPSETETAAYFLQTFTWYATQQVMLKEKYRSLRFTDDNKRFEDNFTLSLAYALGPILQIVYEYDWTFNNAPFPGVLKKDVKQTAGIMLGF